MPDREIDIDLTTSTARTITQLPTEEEVQQYVAKMAGIFDRGLALDRLQVNLPDDMYGEWVHPSMADRLLSMDFVRGDEYIPETINDRAGGKSTLDVIFMVKPKWKHDVDVKLRDAKYNETHVRDKRRKKEEKDFEESMKTIGLTVESQKGHLTKSETTEVSGPEIAQILTNK